MVGRRRAAEGRSGGLARARVILWLTAGALASCNSVEHHTRPVPHEAMLPWLRVGTTSRAETLAILGPPRRQLEGGRILLWELEDDGYHTQRSDEGGRRSLPPGPLSLVVVIGSERVERVALVRLWE
ncbi:MAG: hypothetical protein MUC36_14370 [Planctomycetes bacterium]|jgi:hypothetical protein|nr:hypothetical protein [Planctomycetota bacterium]